MTGDANNWEETGKKVICMKGIYGFLKAKLVITTSHCAQTVNSLLETNFDFESHEAGCSDAAIKLPVLTNVFCFTRA